MPKIEVNEKHLYKLVGKELSEAQLVEILMGAKAELDERLPDQGLLKIELNDTNRPDLWSTQGLARQLRGLLKGEHKNYNFFSQPGALQAAAERVVQVDPQLKDIRPFITAFVAKGKVIDESLLKDIIQTQEKLCDIFGQKRKGIAMGVYRVEQIKFPVQYQAADPATTRFTPLGLSEELNLHGILEQHPKGVEYGWIVKEFKKYPFLVDSKQEVLSFPPIINSARLGAVEVGDKAVFVEMTGLDLEALLLATAIAACDLADEGFEILPVKIVYPYETPFGKEIVTPFYFQRPMELEPAFASKYLGEKMDGETGVQALKQIGHLAQIGNQKIVLTPPVYRNDFLHPVDVIEELMIAKGMSHFKPVMPEDYTLGRLTGVEMFSRKVRDIMVGLGFQEMIYNYLGSRKDFIERMNLNDEGFIEIMNPMTENYSIVRNSILPNLLASEAISAHAVYPHKIFEIGKVAFKDAQESYGTKTSNYLSILHADREVGFNDINSQVAAVLYYIVKDFTLEESSDPRFIKGRVGEIMHKGKKVGVLGELHPTVLANWGIQMPCACAELDLDLLLNK
jgi:phenylalanyl-tRNA synthetase beta chain